ncbi:MAG: hypothetical protein ACFNVY_07940, partial [Actinomyces oris]
GTTVGALAGTALASVVGERIELLGFVLTSLFVVLAIENWRNHPDVGVLCVGLVAGGVGLAIGGSAALLTALVILAVGLVGLYAWRGRRPGASATEPGRRDSRCSPTRRSQSPLWSSPSSPSCAGSCPSRCCAGVRTVRCWPSCPGRCRWGS